MPNSQTSIHFLQLSHPGPFLCAQTQQTQSLVHLVCSLWKCLYGGESNIFTNPEMNLQILLMFFLLQVL